MNPFEDAARRVKAEKLADLIDAAVVSHGVDVEMLLKPDAANARRLCESSAGVKLCSIETWEMAVGMLRERAAARS